MVFPLTGRIYASSPVSLVTTQSTLAKEDGSISAPYRASQILSENFDSVLTFLCRYAFLV
jgi:hypothetical protein